MSYMKLKSIDINNYRSIDNLMFEFEELPDKSNTYALIGINEAGKSSFLQALGLLDEHVKPTASDLQDKSKPISVTYHYEQTVESIKECVSAIKEKFPDIKLDSRKLKNVEVVVDYSLPELAQQKSITFTDITDSIEEKNEIQTLLVDAVYQNTHHSVYWSYDEKHLITKPINLSEFAADPKSISTPLKRCFELCGYETDEKIQNIIKEISSDSTEREQLRESLGEEVTALIKGIWENHNITITFDISGDQIAFHVKDGAKKAKTASQRSDGFKQFVSFLINVSSQKKSETLINTLVLLDEPETHLHPQAQEYFLRELITLTRSDNNICIFATHSNYMIDKTHLARNYKVVKNGNEQTEITQFSEQISTYASVNFEVFGILDESYHNELYDALRQKFVDTQDKIETIGIRPFDQQFFVNDKKLKKSYPEKGKTKQVTLPTYIRNCVHYPENKKSDFSKKLRESIELMRGLDE